MPSNRHVNMFVPFVVPGTSLSKTTNVCTLHFLLSFLVPRLQSLQMRNHIEKIILLSYSIQTGNTELIYLDALFASVLQVSLTRYLDTVRIYGHGPVRCITFALITFYHGARGPTRQSCVTLARQQGSWTNKTGLILAISFIESSLALLFLISFFTCVDTNFVLLIHWILPHLFEHLPSKDFNDLQQY